MAPNLLSSGTRRLAARSISKFAPKLGHIAPDEIAGVACLLTTPAANYMTGVSEQSVEIFSQGML
jgi:hypothetical protein